MWKVSGKVLWLYEAGLPNIKEPVSLDVNKLPWEVAKFEGLFTANILHIIAIP